MSPERRRAPGWQRGLSACSWCGESVSPAAHGSADVAYAGDGVTLAGDKWRVPPASSPCAQRARGVSVTVSVAVRRRRFVAGGVALLVVATALVVVVRPFGGADSGTKGKPVASGAGGDNSGVGCNKYSAVHAETLVSLTDTPMKQSTLSAGPNGDLYLADPTHRRVWRRNTSGRLEAALDGKSSPGADLHDLVAVSIDRDGKLLVLNSEDVQRPTPSGDITTLGSSDAYADAILARQDGTVVVASHDATAWTVQQMALTGRGNGGDKRLVRRPADVERVVGLVEDGSGNLYVGVEMGSALGEIFQLGKDGSVTSIASNIPELKAITSKGNCLYILYSDPNNLSKGYVTFVDLESSQPAKQLPPPQNMLVAPEDWTDIAIGTDGVMYAAGTRGELYRVRSGRVKMDETSRARFCSEARSLKERTLLGSGDSFAHHLTSMVDLLRSLDSISPDALKGNIKVMSDYFQSLERQLSAVGGEPQRISPTPQADQELERMLEGLGRISSFTEETCAIATPSTVQGPAPTTRGTTQDTKSTDATHPCSKADFLSVLDPYQNGNAAIQTVDCKGDTATVSGMDKYGEPKTWRFGWNGSEWVFSS